jgi:hypothetical protein
MAEALMIYCLVLAGPIAVSATENVTDGDFIELPQGDFDQLSRWNIVRKATDAEINANKAIEVASTQAIDGLPEVGEKPATEEGKSADQSGSAETEAPKETAAQKKKREAAEAKAAEELAAQEAAAAQELADKEAAEKLAAETKEPAA